MVIKAHCKINIGLRILRRREDGYHDIESVMYPVRGLYDIVTVEPTEGDEVVLSSLGIVVDCTVDRNLCVRAARLMQQRYGVVGVAITLDKRVPYGAGLGGGSSDATAVIKAINIIYNLNLDDATLVALAAELGSDTPFFVYDTPQVCRGRGEVMTPIGVDINGLWLVVVKPEGEGVSTA
jgi:4-diphosphocytidyl-2-C-methyl-D-erythritol kinase